MRAEAELPFWLVGSPVGVRTRVNFPSPDGRHPLTPEHIRRRYVSEIRDSALVVWRVPENAISGVRAGIDEAAWHDADVARYITSFCRVAKGSGYVQLAAETPQGETLPILSSDQYDPGIHHWHLAAASLLERIHPGSTCDRDDGYDT